MNLIRSFKLGTKGQFLIVSLIATFMTILGFIALYPIMRIQVEAAIDGCATNTTGSIVCVPMDVYSASLLQLAPFFILISILLTIVFASLPVRE